MQLAPRTKVTKGKLGGKSFLYNPASFADSMPVTYTDVKTAGISYPVYVYGGGERRTITFDLYLSDLVEPGITKEFIAHLHNFLPWAKKKGYQFRSPKNFTFAFGWFVKDCHLVDMQIQYTAFSPKLEPIEATVTLTLGIIQ